MTFLQALPYFSIIFFFIQVLDGGRKFAPTGENLARFGVHDYPHYNWFDALGGFYEEREFQDITIIDEYRYF